MAQCVKVDQEKCIGCNTCPLIDPETFALDNATFKAFVKKQPAVFDDKVESSVSACPVGAISIVEE